MSTKKIGALLGISKNTAARVVKEAGVCRFKRFAKEGDRMVNLYRDAGLRAPEIAKRFRTTAQTVYGKLRAASVRRRRWVKPPTECDHHFFDVIDTELKAYLLGWIVSDGCLYISTRVRKHGRTFLETSKRRRWPRYELILSVHKRDRRILVILKRALSANVSITKPKQLDKRVGTRKHKTWENRITLCGKDLIKALLNLGILNRKTGRTTMPNVPEHLLPHFWRGAIEGDGYLYFGKIGKRRQFVLGFTGDKAIVAAFQDFCRRYTPTRANIHPNGKKVVKFNLTDWFAYDVAKVIYQDAGENVLERKFKRFIRASKFFEGRARPQRNWAKAT